MDDKKTEIRVINKLVKRGDIINEMIEENRELLTEEYKDKKQMKRKKVPETFDLMIEGKKETYREAIEKVFKNFEIDQTKYKEKEKYNYPELFQELIKTFISEKGKEEINSKKRTGDKDEIKKQYDRLDIPSFRKKFNLKKFSQIEYREKIIFFEMVYERLLQHYKGTKHEASIQSDYADLKKQYEKYKEFYIEIVALQNKIENFSKRLIEKTVPEIMAISDFNDVILKKQLHFFQENPSFEGIKKLAQIYDIDEGLTVLEKKSKKGKTASDALTEISRMELFREDRLILLRSLQNFLNDAMFDWNMRYRGEFLEDRRAVIFQEYRRKNPGVNFGLVNIPEVPINEVETSNEEKYVKNTYDPFEVDTEKFKSSKKLELLVEYDYHCYQLDFANHVRKQEGLFALCGNDPIEMLKILHEGVEITEENVDLQEQFKKVKSKFIGSLTFDDYSKLVEWAKEKDFSN